MNASDASRSIDPHSPDSLVVRTYQGDAFLAAHLRATARYSPIPQVCGKDAEPQRAGSPFTLQDGQDCPYSIIKDGQDCPSYGWLAALHSSMGHVPYYLEATVAGRIAGVLPLAFVQSRLFGRFLVSLPYLNTAGILADDAAVARMLVDRAVQHACTSSDIAPTDSSMGTFASTRCR